jgi:hypothetical protein
MTRTTLGIIGLAGCLVVSAGCLPSTANIKLRKENQDLRDQVEKLERERAADAARIAALEGSATRPVIASQTQLDRLYTVHGLSFGSLTGGYKDNDEATQDSGVVVHVVPTDQDMQKLKAAGQFSVTLFDLSQPDKPLVGKRSFSLDAAKANWYGQAMLFNYVLKVPFQTRPTGHEILVRVEFTDELTSRKLVAEKNVKVTP